MFRSWQEAYASLIRDGPEMWANCDGTSRETMSVLDLGHLILDVVAATAVSMLALPARRD